MKKEQKKGTVELFLPREFFNSLVSVLTAYIDADSTNKYGVYAARLKRKILKHGRTFTHEGEENVAMYFFEQEAAMLIKLFAIYNSATAKSSADYFLLVGKKEGGESPK